MKTNSQSAMQCKRITFSILIAALVGGAQTAAAATLTLDDFTSGHHKTASHCTASGPLTEVQSGSMVGGLRETSFSVSCQNPYNQEASFHVLGHGARGGALIVESGIRVQESIEVAYGPDPSHRLNLDLGAFDRFRFHFDATDLNQILVLTVFAPDGSYSSVSSCHVPANPTGTPFNLDVPFSEFSPLFNWHDVQVMVFKLNTASAIGANDFALRSFSATDNAGADADANPVPCL